MESGTMRLDLVDLRLFLHVAEDASITRGAARANLALASASARIRGLEQRLGVALLQRHRRGVALTAAGRNLAEHARLVLRQVDRMMGEIGVYARGLKGSIRVLSNTAAMSEHLPRLLAAFLAANPGIDIELEERESADIVAAVAAGSADIGIASDAAASDAVELHPFRGDRLVVVAARGDALARRRRVRLGEILERDFVGLPADSALQRHLASQATRLGAAMKLRIRVGGFDAVCRMVEAGVGLGIVPETAAQRCRRAMAIHPVRLADAWAERRLVLCVRETRALPAAARRLVAHLQGARAAA
jgi:DNA-binding transcriptional LysR family regulator